MDAMVFFRYYSNGIFFVSSSTLFSSTFRQFFSAVTAIYPRQDTSKPNKKNEVYPYLLKGLSIDRPNQVWSIDITYVPIRKSWLYLTAIIDWYSRYIVNWKIDDTLEINFVLEACTEALNNCHPIIMNSDQGSHFTSPKYTSLFLNAGSSISMDHIGRAFDNIFIERFGGISNMRIYIPGAIPALGMHV
jgi:putative transposase